MPQDYDKTAPMAIRMRQAIEHFKTMELPDQLRVMIRAGLWTEEEAQAAIARDAARKARLAKRKSPKPVARKTKKSTEEA